MKQDEALTPFTSRSAATACPWVSMQVRILDTTEGLALSVAVFHVQACNCKCVRTLLLVEPNIQRSRLKVTHGGEGVSRSRLPLLLPTCPREPDSYLRVIAMGMGHSRTWLAQAATSFSTDSFLRAVQGQVHQAVNACLPPRRATVWPSPNTPPLGRTCVRKAVKQPRSTRLAPAARSSPERSSVLSTRQQDSSSPRLSTNK